MEKDSFNWAVAGTGWIASDMAKILESRHRRFYGVTSGHREKAEAYAEKFQIPVVYDSVDELCSDPAVDIVYIATPHNTHYEIAKKALLAGKHCLIEKSITLNSRELEELVTLAEKRKLCLAEAMTTWHMPVMKEVKQLVASGKLGRVQLINVNFGSFKPYDMNNRFFSLQYAGGALLDIGVYALSAIRLFLSEKPSEVSSQWKLCAAGSDEEETILLKNASGQMAAAVISLHSKQPKRAMISCEKGYIEIMEYPRAEKAVITDAETGEKKVLEAGASEEALYYEVLDFEAAIRDRLSEDSTFNPADSSETSGKAADTVSVLETDAMFLQYTRDNVELMTQLRKEWNLRYPGEKW